MLTKLIKDIDWRVEEIKLDEINKYFVVKTKKKLADLEDKSRRNILFLTEFQKETNEKWEESKSFKKDYMKEKLGIEDDISIERTHHTRRIQRNDGTRNKKRTIVVKFLSFKDKSRILNTYREKKLWKEKIFVNQDFSEERASIRKRLLQKTKELRLQNNAAKVLHDRLVVSEKEKGNCISEAQGDP